MCRDMTVSGCMCVCACVQVAGVLRVRVLRAANLMGKDRGGTSDPFAIIHVGSNSKQTRYGLWGIGI